MNRSLALLVVASFALIGGLNARAQTVPGAPVVLSGGGAGAGACSTSKAGLVPATGGGTANFLRADCTFAAPSGGITPSPSIATNGVLVASGTGTARTFTNFTYDGNESYKLNAPSSSNNSLVTAAATGTAEQARFAAQSDQGQMLIGTTSSAVNAGGPFTGGISLVMSQGVERFVTYQGASDGFEWWSVHDPDPTQATRKARLDTQNVWHVVDESGGVACASGEACWYSDPTVHQLFLRNSNDAADAVARMVSATATADTTNATSTYASATGLSVTLQIGAYDCEARVSVQDTVAAEGLKIQNTFTGSLLGGFGTETVKLITTGDPSAVSAFNCQAAAASCAVSAASFNQGGGEISHALQVTTSGVYAIQFAQVAHTTGTASLYKGSSLVCTRL